MLPPLVIPAQGRALLAALVIALLTAFPTGLQAQDFPALSGRVVDQAELLSPEDETAITAKLKALEAQSQRQLVVATINDLQGYDIADYGYRLGRKWGIGDKQRNDGALLIVAPNERRLRIEVGYGLEAYLTDALSSQIIRNDITPAFKAGDFPGGINAGVDRIVTQLQLPPEEAARIAKEAEASPQGTGGNNVVFWLFILIFVVWPVLSAIFSGGKKHGKRGRFGPPVIIWGGGGARRGGGFSGGFSGGGGSFGGGGASGGW